MKSHKAAVTFCVINCYSYCPGKSVVGIDESVPTGQGESYRQSTATELGNFSIGSNFGWESTTTATDRHFSIRADLTGELAEILINRQEYPNPLCPKTLLVFLVHSLEFRGKFDTQY